MLKNFSFTAFLPFILILLISCNGGNNTINDQPVSPATIIASNIDSLKLACQPGDLITRLNDDLQSELIKLLGEKDLSYSHAGIIVVKDNRKMVCHIFPNQPGADTILYEPLDSFINPVKNLSCGLFRYDLSPAEMQGFLQQLDSFHAAQIHFDPIFDTNSDTALYCSEMIGKALKNSTNNRIQCRQIFIPKLMIPVLLKYFKKYKPTYERIASTPFIAIENLYDMPQCKEIMRTKLKYMP